MSLALVAFPVSWDALMDFHTVKMIPQLAVRTPDHAPLGIIHFVTLTVNFFLNCSDTSLASIIFWKWEHNSVF